MPLDEIPEGSDIQCGNYWIRTSDTLLVRQVPKTILNKSMELECFNTGQTDTTTGKNDSAFILLLDVLMDRIGIFHIQRLITQYTLQT